MAGRNDSAQMYRVARYYYMDNLSQSEIAGIEQISRSTVSRLLDKARSSGMVTIDIKMPVNSFIENLEAELTEKLGLERVVIVPVSPNECTEATDEIVIRDLASIAAPVVAEMLTGCRTVGVGWGRTLYTMAGYMPFVERKEPRTVVPLVSNYSMRNRFLQTSTIVSLYGERLGASTYYLNVSSVNDPTQERTESEKLNIRQLETYWNEMDAAVFSLGVPPVKRNPYFMTDDDVKKLTDAETDKDACGEILSQIYFADGHTNIMLGRLTSVVAFPVERLYKVKNSILVAGGVDKAAPIISAANNGYFKTLITDHLTAMDMARHLNSHV